MTCRLHVLLGDQREFPKIVIVERTLGVNGLVQRERARDMDFKRTGFDEAIEFFERRRVVFAIEALDFDVGSLLAGGLHAIRIGGASPFTESR